MPPRISCPAQESESGDEFLLFRQEVPKQTLWELPEDGEKKMMQLLPRMLLHSLVVSTKREHHPLPLPAALVSVVYSPCGIAGMYVSIYQCTVTRFVSYTVYGMWRGQNKDNATSLVCMQKGPYRENCHNFTNMHAFAGRARIHIGRQSFRLYMDG